MVRRTAVAVADTIVLVGADQGACTTSAVAGGVDPEVPCKTGEEPSRQSSCDAEGTRGIRRASGMQGKLGVRVEGRNKEGRERGRPPQTST